MKFIALAGMLAGSTSTLAGVYLVAGLAWTLIVGGVAVTAASLMADVG